MKLPIYQVDAFTANLFAGNPAAVCISEAWLPDQLMQSIAAENNLAETAFIVASEDGFQIRWFTPTVEVDLCGHATLAAAHVAFHHLGQSGDRVVFHSPRSGKLPVERKGTLLTLNFPADDIRLAIAPSVLLDCFSEQATEVWKGKTDYMVVVEHESAVRSYQPDFSRLARVQARGIILTAPGKDTDFVCRFFAPQSGVNEDPVTGSAHTTLTPYWAERLNKKTLTARQVSRRGGHLVCSLEGSRVYISGEAVSFLEGWIQVPG
ncbi:MAG: PhzF family phenazine biosynthesis protein [Cyclobacteriaceae bacterium]|nr:PhzF family phenazine biosynthesis protein [Cyclobacteriaceae bacterium]